MCKHQLMGLYIPFKWIMSVHILFLSICWIGNLVWQSAALPQVTPALTSQPPPFSAGRSFGCLFAWLPPRAGSASCPSSAALGPGRGGRPPALYRQHLRSTPTLAPGWCREAVAQPKGSLVAVGPLLPLFQFLQPPQLAGLEFVLNQTALTTHEVRRRCLLSHICFDPLQA